MNGDEPFLRNHWCVVASNVVRMGLVLFFMILVTIGNGMPSEAFMAYCLILAALCAFVVAWSVILWRKTRYYFLDDEIVVLRETIFRKETRIQYERLASVNVQRDFISRIIGTTRLAFNLNSNVNVLQAEAYIYLKKDEAEKLRTEIYGRMFKATNGAVGTPVEPDVPGEVPEEGVPPQNVHMGATPLEDAEPLVQISTFDIFLHSVIGMPSAQALFGVLMVIYSVVSFFVQSSISVVAVVIFVAEFIIPAIGTFVRYYGYRLVRVGDTVSVSSGLFSTRTNSFKLTKVNFVRVREPLFCRFIGKAILEAEVVGTANENGIPLLCPTKGKKVVMDLFHELLPEFECSEMQEKQSKTSLATIGLYMLLYLALVSVISYFLYQQDLHGWNFLLYLADAILVVYIAVWGALAFKTYRLAMNDSILMVATGSYDRSSNYILFDKIQYSLVRSNPLQRRRGDGRCLVSMLSSRGFTVVQSGVFKADVLENVSSTVMARIRDGRYDFRKYQ